MASIADQFLQYGQLRAKQSQNLGSGINDSIELAMRMRAQRESNLEAARQKEAERIAAQQEASMEPQAILTKAIQFGAEALTPAERAAFEASQQIAGAKVVYDQFGQPRAGYNPIALGTLAAVEPTTGIAATPLMPQMQEEILLPPTFGGQDVLTAPAPKGMPQQSRADFEKFIVGGKLPAPQAEAPMRSTQIAQTAEQRLAEMGITKPVKPERLDFAAAKQYEADIASYNEALKEQRKIVFDEKKLSEADRKAAPEVLKQLNNSMDLIKKTIGQTNKLNTGFVGGGFASFNPFANNVKSNIGTIQAKTALDALIKAKDKGATFGALSDAELQLIKDYTTSLDLAQSEEQLDESLQKLYNAYSDAYQKISAAAGMQDKTATANVDAKLKAAGYSEAQIRAYKQAKGIK